MTPTYEQEAILTAARTTDANLLLRANAGCGKTSTLEMIERAVKAKPCCYLVFNQKNAKEAEKRMQSTTTVRTFNAMGHRIWAASQGINLNLDSASGKGKKCNDILREMIREAPRSAQGPMWNSYWDVLQGVNMAKAVGYIPDGTYLNVRRMCEREEFHATLDETPDDLTADLIDAVLTRSIRSAYDGLIDYNDQIYMPAVFGGTFPQFPLGLVDEVQDLSPVNHALLHRLFNGSRRVIAVGDEYQSIYGFRGAKAEGMIALAERYAMTPLPLSTSFRCPSEIVKAARWRVPNFKWIKEGGHVETLNELQANDIPDACTFLCRNNAPLFRLAMQLLTAGRSVQVAGSDIGPKLVGIMRKLGGEDLGRQQTLGAIAEWQTEREAKGSSSAKDLADCMRVFASHGTTLGLAIAYAEHLFKQTGSVKLMTGHKAKGLEFETVFMLDPWLCRSDEQDLNLRYVMQTRSMDRLFEIESGAIKW